MCDSRGLYCPVIVTAARIGRSAREKTGMLNLRATMDPTIPVSLSIGFAFRMFLWAFDPNTIVRPLFLGIWEGIALYRALSTSPEPQIPYLACALHLTFDLFFTENINTMMTILLSLVLAVLFSDALGSHHAHDIQASRRADARRGRVNGTRTTEVYEFSDSHRLNRARFVDPPHRQEEISTPVARIATKADDSEIALRKNHPPRVIVHVRPHDSPSPRPVPIVGTHLPATLNPFTPPCTPPEPGPSRHPGALVIPQSSNSESHNDELQTPASLAVPQNPSTLPHLDIFAVEQADVHAEEDELQTPLALELRNLPLDVDLLAVEDEGGPLLSEDIPLLDDSTSAGIDLLDAEDGNVSELSLQTGTDLSIISAIDAQLIVAKADHLRKEAWEEQKQKDRLERELGEAVSRRKIRDAFLLRREIEAVEERAQKLHRRAARRQFHGN